MLLNVEINALQAAEESASEPFFSRKESNDRLIVG